MIDEQILKFQAKKMETDFLIICIFLKRKVWSKKKLKLF